MKSPIRISPLTAFLLLVVLLILTIVCLSISSVLSMTADVAACEYDWSRRKDKDQLEKAASNGTPLIEAIKKYHLDHGHPPEYLNELVPEYILEIPGTGHPHYPEFKYRRFDNWNDKIIWYDLGLNPGKSSQIIMYDHDTNALRSYGMFHLYGFGDPEHAILVFLLDQDDRVESISIDRMPGKWDRINFDKKTWNSNVSRIDMVETVLKKLGLVGIHLDKLQAILGKPDGQTTKHEGPWRLWINCDSPFDEACNFEYMSTGSFTSPYLYTHVELLGGWAFVYY